MRVPTEIRCLLAPPHESVYYLTGYMRWCGGAGSRLGEDAGVAGLQEGVAVVSYSPPIDIQSRKWVISVAMWGVRGAYHLSPRSGNHHMAAGGHKWTRGDQDAFV